MPPPPWTKTPVTRSQELAANLSSPPLSPQLLHPYLHSDLLKHDLPAVKTEEKFLFDILI